MTRSERDHLAFATLADLADGHTDCDHATEAHLATCPRCAADLVWLQQVGALLRAEPLVAPPPQAASQARRLFRQVQAVTQPQTRPLLGLLRFDSRRAASLATVRSAQLAPERQLIYQTGVYTLDLRVSTEPDGWILAGQILGAEVAETPTGRAILRGPEGQATSSLSSLAEFRLPPVAPGGYTLAIARGDDTLIVPELYLGDAQ